jgi:hypothetical protein
MQMKIQRASNYNLITKKKVIPKIVGEIKKPLTEKIQ